MDVAINNITTTITVPQVHCTLILHLALVTINNFTSQMQ